MNLSPAGIIWLKGFEKLCHKPYKDVGGVWTVGWGHTRCAAALAEVGLELNDAQCEHLFVWDHTRYEAAVNVLAKGLTLTQGQFDALTSLMFNAGIQAISTSTLVRMLEAQAPPEKIAAEFAKWTHVGGVVERGLVIRREAERKMFLGIA